MNACQAIVIPDCSKPKVLKSSGIKHGIIHVLTETMKQDADLPDNSVKNVLEDKNLEYFSKKSLPQYVSHFVTIATVEFAGVKFKSHSSSGSQYLKYVENEIQCRTKYQFPNLK